MNANRVPVLMYHRVGEPGSDWETRFAIPTCRFAAHMHALKQAGYQAISIDTLVEWLEGAPKLPAGAFLLTFDDGYRDVREHALPILERMNWPYTVFLVSKLIGGQDGWTLESNPSGGLHPLLNADEIRDMQQRGGSFHSHTRNHARLPSLHDAELTDQLASSRQDLRELLGRDVDYLAYPFGQVDDRVEAAAKAAGYRAAFSTQPGFNRTDVNRFRIRRLEVYGTDSPAMLLRKIHLGCNDGTLTYMIRYYFQRLVGYLPGFSR
ncbi:polysaccharide deacetylase family protein [Thiocystis violascens]|uniref:Putative xylanase/chitin deacetylase n=1 Tax=Thiocystis violascens (strain ATCC 17096 / DSM 198 / 6111) TaxID=765911 RepID=I3YFV7_THIV6|nr:polysaccharide deacetylase family protein [Thiocystis violascens]AFL75875.1 putative xylanase/chitin deacetylase [Thiocystis violascens DSM 198]